MRKLLHRVSGMMSMVLLMSMVVSCNKLDISDHEIKFSADGGTKTFTASSETLFVGLKDIQTHAFMIMNSQDDWDKYPFTVEGTWFVIDRESATTFSITAEPNNSGATRGFIIYLEDDSFYDEITVYQKD